MNCFNPESLQSKWFCSSRLQEVVNDTKTLKHEKRESQDWGDQRQSRFVNRNSKFCEEVKQSEEYRALFFHSSSAAYDSGREEKSVATLQKECRMSKQLTQLTGADAN